MLGKKLLSETGTSVESLRALYKKGGDEFKLRSWQAAGRVLLLLFYKFDMPVNLIGAEGILQLFSTVMKQPVDSEGKPKLAPGESHQSVLLWLTHGIGKSFFVDIALQE